MYPFHLELHNVLTLRVATIPNFQKTRCVCWPGWCAGSGKSAPEIAEELSSRLERPAFKQVIEADIISPKGAAAGHAYQIDGPWVDADKPRYACRGATTVFLHGLVQGTILGIDPA